MNVDEILKKFEKKPLDWDEIVYSPDQVAADVPKHLIGAFDHYQVEMAGQAHDVALFKNVAEDGTETYYSTPGSMMSVNRFTGSSYFATACVRPEQDSVEIVSGSAANNYERFWKD